jgi:cellulose synthase/poly-beta-1,6-N-acetylglucosamine synthase-like glycosyltransferase
MRALHTANDRPLRMRPAIDVTAASRRVVAPSRHRWRWIPLLLQAPAALMVVYLDILTAAALRGRSAPEPRPPDRRFALLVPAHDEESTLPRLLTSIAALRYPREHVDVYVVADNSVDATAAIARAATAITYERSDTELRGKGYALQWLLARVRERGARYDAYVILDADSTVSENFLDVMNAHLARGDVAIQAYYGVLNGGDSWAAALRYAALTLYNGLRPRGRDALGLSAGLRGNGMCFAAQLLERFGWDAVTLAEDAEFHLRLVASGLRVAYAAQATVLAEMPVTLRQARSQNMRWERGRLHMIRGYAPRLLRDAVTLRDPVRLDAVAEQVVPPLSVLSALTSLTLAVTLLARSRPGRGLAALVLLGQLAYVLAGMRLAQARLRAYIALLLAPAYIPWKLGVYLTAALGRHDGRWIRTARRP